jgi:hypothetical protein
MRKGQMLNDPVANFEMPPDVEVENGELHLERDHSHSGQQRHQSA